MTDIHLLQLSDFPILQQLQIEEALLRADERNWCIINTGSPDSIVMGISGNPHKLINLEKWSHNTIPIIKRFSGGGTIIVDKNTIFITFINNVKDFEIPCYPQSIMEWSTKFYQPIIPDFQLHEQDYAIKNKKFGGNAQAITKNRWLHHSSLLWDYDRSKMEYLLQPEKQPKYRKKRLHSEFLSKLSNHFFSVKEFTNLLIQQIEGNIIESNLQIAEKILLKPHRKSTIIIKRPC